MSETDRIVMVQNGFGVWKDGRHAASARWSDVTRIVADVAGQAPVGAVRARRIVVTLASGTTVALDGATSGFDSFLTAAATRLPGVGARAGAGGEVVLYERAPGAR